MILLEYTESKKDLKAKDEYRLWKKNARFLYDLVITQSLEWPSLTCQWFPDVENRPDKNYKTQRLLLGTHTNDEEPNYLMIASVQLPKDNQDIDLRKYEESSNEIGGYGTYNIAEIQITQKIVHDGEVNRARYQYENPNVIATKSTSGEVYVFDRTMHASFPRDDETFNPDLRLVGHSQEGYGLAWNPHRSRSTHLISAGYDGIIAHWDIAAASKENRILSPLQTYKGHKSSVSDVGWHMKHDSVFASVSDDGQLMIWDTRDESYQPINHTQAHHMDANCVEFSPGNEWVLATGSSDKTAALWDLRNLNDKLHVLKGHQEEVTQLSWSPHHEAVLGTTSNDRRTFIWDLAKIGQEQSAEEAERGPPELLFVHGGHTNILSDFCWNPAEPWMLASCGDDNVLQAWQIASTIYSQEKHEGSDVMQD